MMKDRKHAFLAAVLGEDGALALAKAAERSEELSGALLPRTVISWLNLASRFEYEGELPGLENTYVAFKKSGPGYSGSVTIGDEVYGFENATLYHVAASVVVAVGAEESVSEDIRDLDIERLGKNIDLLAKARVVTHNLENSVAAIRKRALEGNKPGTGAAASPQAPTPPAAPTSTQPKQSTAVKAPKPSAPALPKAAKPVASSTLKLSEPEAIRACNVCEQLQFKDGKFRGCLCFRDLAKSVKVEWTRPGYLLTLGSDWDQDAIVTFLEAVGRK